MSDDLPRLVGYNQKQALKHRTAFIRYLNTYGFRDYPIHRLDVGLLINELPVQTQRYFTFEQKCEIEDMFYEEFLEYRNSYWYIKDKCIGYGLIATEKNVKTDYWLSIKNRSQCTDILLRSCFYIFKQSAEFKEYIKTIPKCTDTDLINKIEVF